MSESGLLVPQAKFGSSAPQYKGISLALSHSVPYVIYTYRYIHTYIQDIYIGLGWPKSSYGFFCNISWKNLKNFLVNPIYILFQILSHYQDIEYSSPCYTVGPWSLFILYIVLCVYLVFLYHTILKFVLYECGFLSKGRGQ